MTGNYISYPESRGHMHITGPNLDNPIDFRYGMLSDPKGLDLKAHVWQYKKQREIMRRMPVYRGEVSASHPRFPASSAAACVDLLAIASASDGGPSPRRVEGNIVYTPEDDKAIEQFVRENIVHAMHPLGGCKMAAQNRGGVVDGKLSVYGVQGLKIADNSILGSSVAAHTHMTALAVGERAADILIRELGSP
jgi:choline dehydrogenase-like flavoprotein